MRAWASDIASFSWRLRLAPTPLYLPEFQLSSKHGGLKGQGAPEHPISLAFMQLPPALTAALDALLEGVPRKELAAAAQAMSEGYRQGKPSHAIATPLQALAYAVARMPATHAASAA